MHPLSGLQVRSPSNYLLLVGMAAASFAACIVRPILAFAIAAVVVAVAVIRVRRGGPLTSRVAVVAAGLMAGVVVYGAMALVSQVFGSAGSGQGGS